MDGIEHPVADAMEVLVLTQGLDSKYITSFVNNIIFPSSTTYHLQAELSLLSDLQQWPSYVVVTQSRLTILYGPNKLLFPMLIQSMALCTH